MTKKEILYYINVSYSITICVDCSLSEEYPGWVRSITIKSETQLIVEFDIYGYEEGGLYINIKYHDLETLIGELENFLFIKLDNWKYFTRSGEYPQQKNQFDLNQSGKKLKQDLVNKKLRLPKGGIEYSIQSIYWKNIIEGKI
jgi:hypothetical protein